LPALERNVLKYRAFEMMLTLYYAEEIKRFLVNMIKATDHFLDDAKKRFPKGVPNYRAVTDRICKEGLITTAPRDEIVQIVNYRNNIAHELQKMTFDIKHTARESEEGEMISIVGDIRLNGQLALGWPRAIRRQFVGAASAPFRSSCRLWQTLRVHQRRPGHVPGTSGPSAKDENCSRTR
jgi:hypothetical protein